MKEGSQEKSRPFISKIYYLKEKRRSVSECRMDKAKPLTVHLSSLFQQERREVINSQMKQLAKKLDSGRPSEVFQLTERPQSTGQIKNLQSQLTRRQVQTSNGRSRRKQNHPDAFFISDIAQYSDNAPRFHRKKQQLSNKEKSQQRQKTFKFRKLQFTCFLQQQKDKNNPPPPKIVHEIQYQKQEENKWGANSSYTRMKALPTHSIHQRFAKQRIKFTSNSLKLQSNKKILPEVW